MIFSSPRRTIRRGFTLVEMLVVVAIIGILAGLISAVAVRAKRTAEQAVITVDFSELDRVLKVYKDKYGEYPPDGTNPTDANSNGIPDSFERHFQKVFPRANLLSELGILFQVYKFPCDPSNPGQLQAFFQNYTPATALAFWLGGMQDDDYSTVAAKNPKSLYIGFSSNPMQPLSDKTGSTFSTSASKSRTSPMFDFDTDRINDPTGAAVSNTIFRQYLGKANVPFPYVYFRAELNQKYPYLTPSTLGAQLSNRAKFYMDPVKGPKPYYDSTSQSWINSTSFQLIFCGFDNTFGAGNWYPLGKWPPNPKPLPLPYNWQVIYYQYDNANLDDITNFSGGAVGDKVP